MQAKEGTEILVPGADGHSLALALLHAQIFLRSESHSVQDAGNY